jgi:ABC-2 type transport system permease protein
MFEVARYESERRALGAVAIAVGLSLLTGMVLAIAPQILSEVDLSELAQAYPESLKNAFGIEAIGTFEGFLATELYQFAWVILLGLYFAYATGSVIAGDIERERMDMLLSTPVSRTKVVVEKFLSVVPSILLINFVVFVVVYVGSVLIDEPLTFMDILAVHALSVPYLMACAAIGLVFSVLFSRESTAQRAGIGTVFALFMVETLVTDTDYEWVGLLSPTHYYDPTEILVHSDYNLMGAGILLEVAALLVVVSLLWFRRRDI